jgi:NhaP-type Na+/H+ or K+/H+ antiporter
MRRRSSCSAPRSCSRCSSGWTWSVALYALLSLTVDATTLTVIASIVLHGLTARPLTERYAMATTRRRSRHGHAPATP